MQNLTGTLTALGRNQEALVMSEKLLEFQRRVLPEHHPHIGECVKMIIRPEFLMPDCVAADAMAVLALNYDKLGRHQDALMLWEKTLEFHRRVLPENHPQIGLVL
jgi:hypothetical protein